MGGSVILRGKWPDWTRKTYGSGYGCGDGYGYGSGYGCGDGDGDGYGDGDGDGGGYGYGDGDGGGYGYGDGDGGGYGYGDGDGYWCAVANSGKQSDGVRALWWSDAEGRPCNGGTGDPVSPGMVQEIVGPLELCGSGALHATLNPGKWRGDRLWIVELHGEVVGNDEKMGALKRTIMAEVPIGRGSE